MTMKQLNIFDFAELFDIDPETFSSETRQLINSLNFRYRVITGDELEHLILRILHRVESDRQIVGAPERKKTWEDGWRENLDEYRESGFSDQSLVPKFIRRDQPLRLRQAYISGEDPNFELNFIRVLRNWFAHEFFFGVDEIHEFGCGTGFNLLALAETFPSKKYFGSDFVGSSVDLVNAIGRVKNIALEGRIFDMKVPCYSYTLGRKSGVFTFGSLEQLAGDIDPFLDFLLSNNPGICLHVEPSEDLYDRNNLSDFLAYKFQSRRNYTSGLLQKLRDLETEGRVQVLKERRLFFGSLFMEGYNFFCLEEN